MTDETPAKKTFWQKFWSTLATVAAHVAVYAAEHPDQVIAIVQAQKEKK